eukprot:356192-Hanusia_phi.AAC.2
MPMMLDQLDQSGVTQTCKGTKRDDAAGCCSKNSQRYRMRGSEDDLFTVEYPASSRDAGRNRGSRVP